MNAPRLIQENLNPNGRAPYSAKGPVKPTRATRLPAKKSMFSFRGFTYDPERHRQLVFESNLEYQAATIMSADRRLKDIEDQPAAVRFVAANGKIKRHTFDFRITTVTGERFALAIKPFAKVERSGLPEIITAIRQQVGQDFADHYLIRTEREFSREAYVTARLKLRSRQVANSDQVAALAGRVTDLTGPTTIIDFLELCGSGLESFMDAIALIDCGVLAMVHPASALCELSFIKRPSNPFTPEHQS